MIYNKTSNAVEILKQHISQDPDLAILVEEERKRLKIADKIRESRQRIGISQKEVAKRTDTT